MTKEQAIELVQRHLATHQPGAYRLRVVADASRWEDDAWYICVGPDREDIRRYDYYDILAQVEREIEDETDVHVTLVPPPAGAA